MHEKTSRIDDSEPAFPVELEVPSRSTDPLATPHNKQFPGLSLRDYFAAAALQGVLANPEKIPASALDGLTTYQFLARDAYKQADAMLAARKTGGE